MRRIRLILVLFLVIATLTISAGAATAAKSVSGYATVSSDGSCQMTMTATFRLEQPMSDLRFPLPESASNITINGSRGHGRVENGLRQLDLSNVIGKTAGEFTLTFHYTLHELIVTNDAGLLELKLPILSGFAYPVQALEFSVTLPGPVDAKPAFSSGYHQANIEKDLSFTVSGATVSGVSQVELKDHETLMMTLLVTEEMFPQTKITPPDFKTLNTLITVFSLLAGVYWVLFLRNLPTWPALRADPPEGYSAGELGSVLHLQGGDLSMMVFSWAQLGYLLIRLERSGRVTLYKQMEMGNERSAFEQRCFKLLFGKRDMVDTGSLRYAELCRATSKMQPNLAFFIHRKSGNLRVFRALAALAGMFCGISISIGLSSGAALQWFLVIVMGALALVSSWCIQGWALTIFSPDKRSLWWALGISAFWLLLGALSKLFSLGVTMVLLQLFAGILYAIGGRRTRAGRQAMGETLGLRRYLATVSKNRLDAICQDNPEYFHQLAPYALALGADRAFARQFGNIPLGPCPYISTGLDGAMRASQWSGVMRRVYQSMTARQKNSVVEKITGILRMFMR